MCACVRVCVCACVRVCVCACARVRECASARVRECACARVRGNGVYLVDGGSCVLKLVLVLVYDPSHVTLWSLPVHASLCEWKFIEPGRCPQSLDRLLCRVPIQVHDLSSYQPHIR